MRALIDGRSWRPAASLVIGGLRSAALAVTSLGNMALSGQNIEVVPPAEEPEEMPLPSDPKAIFLGGLFSLALLAAAYVAREVIMPLVFAIVLSLLLQSALRFLERLRIPRTLVLKRVEQSALAGVSYSITRR
jgi:hypothetical protein